VGTGDGESSGTGVITIVLGLGLVRGSIVYCAQYFWPFRSTFAPQTWYPAGTLVGGELVAVATHSFDEELK
jgi:hypothetical protein